MKNETQTLSQQLRVIADELEKQSKPKEFIVGKWYRHKNSKSLCIYKQYGASNIGFESASFNKWDDNIYMSNISEWIEAAPEEIQTALVKEAEERGFKPGIRLEFSLCTKEINTSSEGYKYYAEQDDLQLNGTRVYQKGNWSIPAKPEPIMIGPYEVVFEGNFANINGQQYHINFWYKLKGIRAVHGFVGYIQGHPLTSDIIDRVIGRLEC